MKKVLFLCTGNSARSQLAEALTNHFCSNTWQAASAGVAPSGHVHPQALAVLQELGVETRALYSKSLEDFRNQSFDLIVTVCDSAAAECPVWLHEGQVVHVPFADPSHVIGPGDAKRQAFRETRERMRTTLLPQLDTWVAT